MLLLLPAHPVCPGQKFHRAVKRLFVCVMCNCTVLTVPVDGCINMLICSVLLWLDGV